MPLPSMARVRVDPGPHRSRPFEKFSLGPRDADAQADLTGIRSPGGIAGGGAEREVAAEGWCERHPVALERGGVDVGNVVTNHIKSA